MKRILFAISLMAATTASFAQVAKPMEDVNKVIDNTVDSLKADHSMLMIRYVNPSNTGHTFLPQVKKVANFST